MDIDEIPQEYIEKVGGDDYRATSYMGSRDKQERKDVDFDPDPASSEVIPPFLAVVRSRHQAAMASFCFGVMPPRPVHSSARGSRRIRGRTSSCTSFPPCLTITAAASFRGEAQPFTPAISRRAAAAASRWPAPIPWMRH